jgi:glycosyltransferase involved in cell wall biosynthesis
VKIAVLSDTRLPTARTYAGHGLGKVMIALAEGLRDCGHSVTLYAHPDSVFDGQLVTRTDEREFADMVFSQYDAIIDGGHFHLLAQKQPQLPVINLSHDRENPPGRNAVFPSKAHRDWHGYNERNGRVIYNGVDVPAKIDATPGKPYFAYLSMMHQPKAPLMAFEAARLAGVRLVLAGPTPPAPPPGCEYVGPLMGDDKLKFLAGATALLFPAATEAGPLTPLEAQSVGCPVIVSAYGAASENMADGVTGYVVRDTLEMADAISKIDAIQRADCVKWVRDNRSTEQMIDAYDKLLAGVSVGIRW